MSSKFIFKKGDLIGVNERDHIYGYLIAQVIRENRFFYCLCINTGVYHFLVFDDQHHFLLCPEFDLDVKPDIDVLSLGVDFYQALDRLFGYAEELSVDDLTDD
jgi:hypothetical protein